MTRPRLFGKDPSKEPVVVPWNCDLPTPEFAMNYGVDETPVPAGKCGGCGGYGSYGFTGGGRAGRYPCRDCGGTGLAS